ncbi:MAG: ABC transporter ATP-binding protein [Planctomycetaceae bacterium]|jgi:ABC-2 type transport system ATP-binding protein|nr:ABC transporter ATP-binding protein [Planctomycetaceae bacterium]
MESIISLQNVTKRYGGFLALDDVSVEIPPGIIGLLGPNGAGKSTLIKALLGLVKLTAGDGAILGHQVAPVNFQKIRSQVGYMPEDDCFIEGIAGVEMVQFAAQLTGYPKLRSLQRAHEVLDFCGTGQERYRQVETYSTGMRQKLKFAQAIVHSPKLLVLDEPTSGLDPEERTAMLNRIKLLGVESSMSVMICTHILKDVQDICEYAAVMVAGRVPLLQTVEKLRKPATPSFQIRVLGDPNPFMAEVVQRGATAVLGNNNVITVSNIDSRGDRLIWECAKSVQVSVQSVVPAKVSMEQVFMQVVQEATNGH